MQSLGDYVVQLVALVKLNADQGKHRKYHMMTDQKADL